MKLQIKRNQGCSEQLKNLTNDFKKIILKGLNILI